MYIHDDRNINNEDKGGKRKSDKRTGIHFISNHYLGVFFNLPNPALGVGLSGLGQAGQADNRAGRQAGGQAVRTAGHSPEADGNGVLGGLLSLERNLGGHDALALRDEVALGTRAVTELALSLVALRVCMCINVH